jgi:predicted nucleotidyltransferase
MEIMDNKNRFSFSKKNSYIGKLLNGLPVEEFLKNYWEERPFFKFYVSHDNPFSISLKELEKILNINSISFPFVEGIKNGKRMREKELVSLNRSKNFKIIDFQRLLPIIIEGKTIVIQSTQLLIRRQYLEFTKLENELFLKVNGNLYISPKHSISGFKPHIDNHDVFIFQIFGKKRWRIYDNPTNNNEAANIVKYQKIDPDFEFDLNQGEAIYIPKGFVHNAFTLESPSIHLTIGLSRGKQDEDYKKYSFFFGRRKIDFKNNFFNTNSNLLHLWGGDRTGQNSILSSLCDISLETILCIPNNLRYRILERQNSISIYIGDVSVIFPSILKKALDNIQSKFKITVKDLDDNLDDTTKVMFVNKLVQCGFLNVLNPILTSEVTKGISKKLFYFKIKEDEILNPTSESLINFEWRQVADDIVTIIKSVLDKDFVSAYLTGSVALGQQIDYVSDIDIVILTNSKIERMIIREIEIAMKEVELSFKKAKYINFSLISFDDVFHGENKNYYQFALKTQSFFLSGHYDVREKISPQKLNYSNCHYAKDFYKFFGRSLYLIENNDDSNFIKLMTYKSMKLFLRSAFELVMVKEKKFTRNLYSCYYILKIYFPEDELLFYQILNLAINPTESKDELFKIVDAFLKWFNSQYKNYDRISREHSILELGDC